MKTSLSPSDLLRQIALIQRMERGKLCVIRHGPSGPYYNHQSWEAGKNTSRYVPADQVAAMQEAIAGWRQFEALIEQYANCVIEKTRQEMAAGAKKKTRPISSWPKSRKSSS